MEPKKIEEKIIKTLELRRDFFKRNPASIEKVGNSVKIFFRFWDLQLTKEEYEKLKDKLIWSCVSCCGWGSFKEEEEGEFIILRGYPCSCHPTHWGWHITL
jgi:hypothetical protein